MATIALESPYYGKRRPPWQQGSKLSRVSDLLTLGRATIEESLYLLAWADRAGFNRLGAPACRPCNAGEGCQGAAAASGMFSVLRADVKKRAFVAL